VDREIGDHKGFRLRARHGFEVVEDMGERDVGGVRKP
jgi:hypothetical protein